MAAGDATPKRGLIDNILFQIGAWGLIATTAIMLYVVVMRYFFNLPPIWSEEVPKTLFVWLVFLSGGLATKLGQNVRVAFLVDKMRPRLRYAIECVMHVFATALLVVVCVYSWPMVELHARFPVLATGWPRSVLSLAIPVGCALMALFQLGLLWRAWRNYRAAG
jgi:TRAP-type C4-dicarboxylate transport system permease small subunit